MKMGEMNRIYLALLQVMFFMCPICFSCSEIHLPSGHLSQNTEKTYNEVFYCWLIKVPEDSYVRITFQNIRFLRSACNSMYVEVAILGTNTAHKFCHSSSPHPIFALSDVRISYYHSGVDEWYRESLFSLKYERESLICARPNHFRCSDHSCIHQDKVCNRVFDCDNGEDEKGCRQNIDAFEGVEDTRNNTVTWLKNQRSDSVGWGKNTHRAITALYLAKEVAFEIKSNTEEKLLAKQLELQVAVALLRNSTDMLSISDLSMFINALIITCHNPRRFYGFDLVQILSDRIAIYNKPCPGAYLTLCSLNWPFLVPSDVTRLLKLLKPQSHFPFLLEIQAMTVMALSCIQKKMNLEEIANASAVYNSTIEKFIEAQLPDGSFGNIYTTALITQALIASGQEGNMDWKINSTVKYLREQLNSTTDFLSVYLTLPIFSSTSLASISMANCSNSSETHDGSVFQGSVISDILKKLEEKMKIQYSLYIGDQKDVIHTIYLSVPMSSTVYDVMRTAQVHDSKYKFLHRDMSGRMYIYSIAGIINDPEEGKFWLLYTTSAPSKNMIVFRAENPNNLTIHDGDHLIMWFKTADVQMEEMNKESY